MSARPDAAAWTRRHLTLALRAAALCVVGLVLTWVMAELVPATRLRDAAALHGFIDLGRPWIDTLANGLLHLLNPAITTLAVAALATIAWRRGRRRLALVIPIVVGGAVGSSELLKPLLAHSHDWMVATRYVTDASWPSGHSTAAMALALCAVLVAPHRLRPLVALIGAAFTVAVGFALLTLAWHMPSDVIGGFLIAALWTSLAVAALLGGVRRWPVQDRAAPEGAARLPALPRHSGLPLARLGMIAGVGVAGLALLGSIAVNPRVLAAFAIAHHSLMVAAAAIAALAGVLFSSITAGLRH